MKRPCLACSLLFALLWPAYGARAGAPAQVTDTGPTKETAPAGRARRPVRKAVVTLRDGTRLVGRISSLKNGLISVETEQLGTMTVPLAGVESVVFAPVNATGRSRSAGSGMGRTYSGRRGPVPRSSDAPARSAAPFPSSKAAGTHIQELMQALTGDPDIMRSISALLEDPDIQAVLRDPAIQRAVQSGDLLPLMKNPKIINLLRNSKIQEVSRRIVNGRKR